MNPYSVFDTFAESVSPQPDNRGAAYNPFEQGGRKIAADYIRQGEADNAARMREEQRANQAMERQSIAEGRALERSLAHDPIEDELKTHAQRIADIHRQRKGINAQVESFITDDGPAGGGDLFTRDDLTGKPMKVRGEYVPKLGAEVEDLRAKAAKKTGFFAGVISPSKSIGDPTDDATLAASRLAELEPKHRLKLEKLDRIRKPLADLDQAEQAIRSRMGELSAIREARYAPPPSQSFAPTGLDAASTGDPAAPGVPTTTEVTPTADVPPETPRVTAAGMVRLHALLKKSEAAGDLIEAENLRGRLDAGMRELDEPRQQRVMKQTRDPGFWSEFGARGRDLAMSFGSGANSVIKMAGDLYGLATGDMGNAVSAYGKEAMDYYDAKKSPEMKEAEAARRAVIDAQPDELGKAWAYVKETVKNPALFASLAVENAPLMVGTGGVGSVARVGAEKLLLRNAATEAAKQIAAKQAARIGLGAAVGTGALMQGADVGGDQYNELVTSLDAMPAGQAAQIPEIADLMERGATLDEAKLSLALTQARKTGVLAGALSAVAQNLPGGQTVERALVGGATKKAGSRLAGGVAGAVGEGLSEVVEEGGGQMIKNAEAQPVDPARPIMQGVGETAAQAALAAGPLGGVAGAIHAEPGHRGPAAEESTAEPTPTTPPPAEEAPSPISEKTGYRFTDSSGRKTEVMADGMRDAVRQLPADFGEVVSVEPFAASGIVTPSATGSSAGSERPVTEPASAPAQSSGGNVVGADQTETAPGANDGADRLGGDSAGVGADAGGNRGSVAPLGDQSRVAEPGPVDSRKAPDAKSPVDAEPARGGASDSETSPRRSEDVASLAGEKIDRKWTAFSPESQSLGIPRADMPQVKAEHRGALTQFLKARDITSTEEEIRPDQLKPTQAEFAPEKVEKARKFAGGDRAILVSSDNHVVDGHHQWMAKFTDAPTEPIRVIRLNAPIREVLAQMKEFPSVESAGGSTTANTPESAPKPITQETNATEPKPEASVAAPVPIAPEPSVTATESGPAGNESAPPAALPERTPDTMSEAIAVSSPSGRMSKSTKAAAVERVRENLFGKEGLPAPAAKQPTEIESLRHRAAELRGMAERGLKPKAYRKEADRLDQRATKLEQAQQTSVSAATKAPTAEEAANDYQRAKSVLTQSPNVADTALVKERQAALDSFTARYAGEKGTITDALKSAAQAAAVHYSAEAQSAVDKVAAEVSPEATMRDKHRELIRQIDAALAVAPVINPNEIADKDAQKQAQSALNATSLTAEELANRRHVSPDAVGSVAIKAGTANMRIRADYVTLEKMRRRLEKGVGKPTEVVRAEAPGSLSAEEMKDLKDGRTDVATPEGRAILDRATAAQLEKLGLGKDFVRVAPGQVLKTKGAAMLQRLKDGTGNQTFDVETAKPIASLDDGTPGAQVWRDTAPDEIPESLRQHVSEFETGLNRSRGEGEPAVSLTPKALDDSGARLPAGANPDRFRRQVEQVFGKRIVFVEPSSAVEWGAASSPQRANTVLVNTRTEAPLMALTGHELTHNLKAQRPDLHRALTAAIAELAPQPEGYAEKKRLQGYDTSERVSDEWVSDVVGERWIEPEFWQEVRRVTAASPSTFTDLAETALAWLKRIAVRAKNALSGQAKAEFLPRVEQVRTEIANTLRDFANDGPYTENPSADTSAEELGIDAAKPDAAPEGARFEEGGPAAEPKPEKPAPVPDKPGWYFRSEPDSLRAAGAKVARQVFERRTHADAAATAKTVVDEVGEEQASRLALDRNDNGVPGDVKTIIYGEVLSRKAKRLADPTTSPADRARLQREIQQLDNVKAPAFTERGQEISALQQVYKDVRSATMSEYLNEVRRRQTAALGGESAKGELQDASRVLTKVNADAIEKAAGELGARLDKVDVGAPLWQQYREWAATRLLDWVEDRVTAPEDKAPLVEFTNRILDEIRNRMEAMMPKTPGQERPKPTASDLLREAVENKEKYAEVVKTARAAFVEQYGEGSPIVDEIDVALGNIGLKPYGRRLLDKAIDEAHAAMKTNVTELARMHFTNADRLHRNMADALTVVAGVPKSEAAALAADIEKRMQELTADAKKQAIERLRKKYDTPRAKRILTAIERAVLLNNYGAMGRTDLADVVAKELKLPSVDPTQMTTLSKLADAVETAPNEADKARAELSLVNEMRVVRGISKTDIATSIWYANMLSGYTTQLANVGGNVMNGTLNLAAVMATNPKHAGQALRGWINGFGEGWQQAKAIVATGRGSREFDAKTGAASPVLELVDYQREFPNLNETVASGLNLHAKALRYVFRMMKGVDAAFYYPAREAYARVVAAKLLEGKYEGKELYAKVRETLAISPSAFAQAKEKAQREGFSGLELALRTANIIEDMRRGSSVGKEASNLSEKFALETTFNNEPVGWAGVFYRHAVDMTDRMTPGGVPVLKAFLPFIRIPTNLFNASMNYTPVGTVRAFRGMETATKGQRIEFTPDERNRLLVQSIGGSLAMGGLASLALGAGGDNGDEPAFTITATGPADYRARQQLQATGWNSHSIKVGDAWISYKDSPLLTPLALVGNVVDAVRYKKTTDDLTLGNMVTDAALKAPRVIFETSMLSGLGQLFDLLQSKASPDQVRQFLTRTALATTVPNLLGQIDRTFNPEARLPDGELGQVGAALPFVRNLGSVKTDVLGESVERAPLERFVSLEPNDPVREVLRDKNVFISVPQRDTKIGGHAMTPEQYEAFVRVSGEAIRKRLSGAVPQIRGMKREDAERFVDRITAQERQRAKVLVSRSTVAGRN